MAAGMEWEATAPAKVVKREVEAMAGKLKEEDEPMDGNSSLIRMHNLYFICTNMHHALICRADSHVSNV